MSIEYLVEKYNKLVYKICYDMLGSSLDAQDTTQEVYLSLYINFERYGNLSENDIKNIICKIALNKCKDILKSKARKLQNLTSDDVAYSKCASKFGITKEQAKESYQTVNSKGGWWYQDEYPDIFEKYASQYN